jgi:alpha-glucosidase (family GH31 glycosyl hydrolase)
LQFQAGYFTDEDVDSWAKKKTYPDGFVVSAPIDCSRRKSVVLRFQQKFRWWDYKQNDTSGLFVGVSTDSVHWHEWDVRHGIPPASDMFEPLSEEIDVSAWAAHQPKVYLRFYWKGLMGWYWMVDDIALSEAYDHDLAITRLVSNTGSGNHFTKADALIVRIRNAGAKDVEKGVTVHCAIDGDRVITAKTGGLAADSERDVIFPAVGLDDRPSHSLVFSINDPADEYKANDTLKATVSAEATALGNLTGYKRDTGGFYFSSGVTKVKLNFYRADIFRLQLAPDGIFTDPTGGDIVVAQPPGNLSVTAVDKGAYYAIGSNKCVVRVYKYPLRFAMYDATDRKMIWREIKPLSFGEKTVQTLARQEDEYFYGCGMQNGYFSHRDKDILIEKGGGWDDGGRANPAPFYMSTSGYGVLRNTFDVGRYSFKDTLTLAHDEDRFDAFYFYGPSLKEVLDGYTQISGRPFLMPRWALSLGDANCYNKPDRNKRPQTTPDVIWKVADEYVRRDMPRGWILPNDGYGCGYVKLDSVVTELHKRGIYTGLWTENGVDRIATEVGKYGTRLCKLDVAWVGPGYKYALDGCKAAYEGIEHNCTGRGFVWSVMGWAGTQRYSTVWSGDQSGNWEYIRFHIPTFIGAGLSAQNAASSDIDGIFGGSDSTYVRDLQWKCFIPVLMTMSGWAKKDKQPWTYGEPYTSINRKYLRLKMRMTPYMYTLCYDAYKTGVPATRGLVLEFPADTTVRGVLTQYEFMNGPSLLVAPVYKTGGMRDSIYLPEGKWFDYWSGQTYEGKQWLRNYDAPLDKLPLFVRGGAIIPMYPEMNYDGERRADTLTLDIYPGRKDVFELYEDDGITRAYKEGASATTRIGVASGEGISVDIHPARGHYQGMYRRRAYLLQVHTGEAPASVQLNGRNIAPGAGAGVGYYFDAHDRGGILYIRTAFLPTDSLQHIHISSQGAYAGPVSAHNLRFDHLAARWDEAIPLGNGLLGALVWQKAGRLRLSLDRADLWDERASLDLAKGSFAWVEQQVRKKDYTPVQQWGDEPYDQRPYPTKLPAAAMDFDISVFGKVVSNTLDIQTAVNTVRFESGVVFKCYIGARQPRGYFSFDNIGSTPVPNLIVPNYNTGQNVEDNSHAGAGLQTLGYAKGTVVRGPERILYRQPTYDGRYYEVLIRWRRSGNRVTGCWTITCNRPAVMEAGDASAWKAHVAWWKKFWAQSSVRLPDTMLEKQYYLEQYKLGSVARAGAPAITLQAVWTADNGSLPPWKGDFHNDLNTQLSYWPCYTGNHLAASATYTDWLWKIRRKNLAYTKQYFGVDGLNVPGVATLDGDPMGGWIQYSLSPTIGAWCAQHFYWQWKYSMDEAFLKNRAYPYIHEVATYLENITRYKDGARQLPLSSSPEYNDNDLSAWFLQWTNYDLSLVKFLFGAAIEVSRAAGNPGEGRHWEQVLGQLPDYTVNETGLSVAPGQNPDQSHRHMSPYMAIYPMALLDINKAKDSLVIEKSLRHIREYGTRAWCGYSFSWMASLYARAYKADSAVKQLRIFASNFCSPNSFHLNGDQKGGQYSSFTYRPFTLEGNFAFAEGIQELLLQSRDGYLQVLPAIPEEWKDLSFEHLRGEGAFLVSAKRIGGLDRSVTVFSEAGGRLRIKLPPGLWKSASPVTREEGGIVSLYMAKGQTVVFEK